LIALNVHVLFDRVTPRVGCGDCQYQSHGKIRPNAWLGSCRAGMKKHSSFSRLFGNLERNLRRQMKRGRHGGGASPVCFHQLRSLDKSLIGIAVHLHQISKPSPNFIQSMFRPLLPTHARPHHPERGRKSTHQRCDRAAGRNRSRRCDCI
jgi:hypothetical protein